jgi:protein phosphatase
MSRYQPEPDPFPSPPRARLEVLGAARTDRGQERSDNQDSAAIGEAATGQAWEPPAALALRVEAASFYAVVCDGMGGEAGGALASRLAVETIVSAMRASWLARTAAPVAGGGALAPEGAHAAGGALAEAALVDALVASLEAASARIKQAAREEPLYARMGTTATLAAVAHGALLCAQIGDSRAYLLRRGRLAQLTEDQTMAEYLRKSGAVPADQISAIVGPNVILQALGSSTRLEVAVTRTPLAHGDAVLLCSDGLYGVLDDLTIARVLDESPELGAACDELIARANAAGGPDNISCVAFRVLDESLAASSAEPATTALRDYLMQHRDRVR